MQLQLLGSKLKKQSCHLAISQVPSIYPKPKMRPVPVSQIATVPVSWISKFISLNACVSTKSMISLTVVPHILQRQSTEGCITNATWPRSSCNLMSGWSKRSGPSPLSRISSLALLAAWRRAEEMERRERERWRYWRVVSMVELGMW